MRALIAVARRAAEELVRNYTDASMLHALGRELLAAVEAEERRAPAGSAVQQDEAAEDFERWLRDCDVVRPDGTFNADQARLELQDYHFILDQVPKVYMEVTGDRLSKPNYFAHAVIGVFEDQRRADNDEAVAEALRPVRNVIDAHATADCDACPNDPGDPCVHRKLFALRDGLSPVAPTEGPGC